MQVHFEMFTVKRTRGVVFALTSSLAWTTFDVLTDNDLLGDRAAAFMMQGTKIMQLMCSRDRQVFTV